MAVAFSPACSEEVTPPSPPPAPAAVRISVDSLSFVGVIGQPDSPAQSFDIRSDSSWRVTTSGDWIVVSPDSGRGDATVEVSVRPLLLVGDVTDTIRIAAGPGVAQVPVHLHRTGRPPRGLLYGVPYLDSAYGQRGDSVFVALPDGRSEHALWFPREPSGFPQDHWLPATGRFWGPMFSPGGDSIAFIAPTPFGRFLGVATLDGRTLGGSLMPTYGSGCFGDGIGAGWSPDGRKLAWMCHNKLGQAFLNGVFQSSVRAPSEGTPYFAPDGTWIMINGALVSATLTRPDVSLSLGGIGIGWAPDNRIVLLGPGLGWCGRGVFTVPRAGGTPKRLLGPDYDYASFSPDGKKLLARRCSPSVAIELMDADGTNVTWRMPGADWAAWRP